MKNPVDPKHNEYAFKELIKSVRPDIFVLMDLMDSYGINEYILFKFIRSLVNISSGTGWGRIQIFITNNKVTTMETIESDKVEEVVSKIQKEDKFNGEIRRKKDGSSHLSFNDLLNKS